VFPCVQIIQRQAPLSKGQRALNFLKLGGSVSEKMI
jgi:hypothetical protein